MTRETEFVPASQLKDNDELVGHGKIINTTSNGLLVTLTTKYGSFTKSARAPMERYTEGRVEYAKRTRTIEPPALIRRFMVDENGQRTNNPDEAYVAGE